MTLQEILQADAAVVLDGGAAEDALYLPVGADPRAIKVFVDRQEETSSTEPRGELTPIVVTATNSSLYGITGAEVTPQDRIRLAKVKGGEHVALRIVRVRDENPGWLELEVS